MTSLSNLSQDQIALLKHPQLKALVDQLNNAKAADAAAKRAELVAQLAPIEEELTSLRERSRSAPSMHAAGIQAGAPPLGTAEYFSQRRASLLESSRDLRRQICALDGAVEFCSHESLLSAWTHAPKAPEQDARDALPPMPNADPTRHTRPKVGWL